MADSINNSVSNKLITGTKEDDTIRNSGQNVTISGGEGNDSIRNSGVAVSINGDAGNDKIYNSSVASSVTITGGAGKDSIRNYSPNVTITGDASNDTVRNYASTVIIDGGAGNDFLQNVSGTNVLIDGSAGNDTVSNSGDNVTINSGTGNDSVNNSGSNVTITSGDGKDYISTSSLTSNVFILGEENNDSIVIKGNNISADGGAGDDSITNDGASSIIDGGAGDDTIRNDGIYITLTGGEGNDNFYNSSITSYVTIDGGLGDDLISVGGSSISVNGGDGFDTVYSYGDSITINSGIGNDFVEITGNNSFIDSGTGDDSISNDGKYITINGNEGNDTITNTSLASYATLNGGAGDDYFTVSGNNISIDGGDGADSLRNSGSNITLTGGSGNDYFYNSSLASSVTINGGDGNDIIRNNGVNVMITSGAGNDNIQNSLSANVTVRGGTGNDSIKNVSSTNVLFEYNPGDGDDTIDGFNETATLKIGDGTGTYSKVTNSKDLIITVGDGSIILKKAATLPSVNILGKEIFYEPTWTLNGRTAIYGVAGGDPIVTVSGVKSLEGISLNGTTVTVANSSLDQTAVTISKGYILQIAEDVPTPTTIRADWTLDGTTATYTGTSTTAGYSLADNKINYVLESSGETFAVNGVQSAEGLALNKKVVTVSKYALNQSTVTLSDNDYTLALADNVPTVTTIAAGWTFSNGTATYKKESTTAGYEIINNNIVYDAATGGESFTVSGVQSTLGLLLNDTIVTVENSALNFSNVRISDGYGLNLGSDVEESIVETDWQTLANGNVAYLMNSTMAGYQLEDNQINYIESIAGETLAELSGIGFSSTLAAYDDGITLTADNFAGDVVAISGESSKFELFAGNYSGNSFTGTDKRDTINNFGSSLAIDGNAGKDNITSTGINVTIKGGKGDDKISLGGFGGNTLVYSDGDGNDVIYNFKNNNVLQILGTTEIEDSIKNNDVVFKVGDGKITLKDVATTSTKISVVGAEENKTISENIYSQEGIIRGDTIELAANFKGTYKQGTNINFVDGSHLKMGITIEGNTTGGTLTGGAGNDTFVYNGGNVTITNYATTDKISIADGLIYDNYTLDNSDVIISYKNNNVLTIQNGKDKEIAFAKSKPMIYTAEGIFGSKKKSLTLAADTEDSFSAAKNSKLITIDGSSVNNALEIHGNNKANYIKAGSGGSTLNGGRGKDTLIGGSGVDVFVYAKNSGNKVISGCGSEDIISLDGGANISQITTRNDKIIFKVDSKTIMIENATKFTFVENGVARTYDNGKLISSDGKSITLPSDSKGSFELGSRNYKDYDNVSAEFSKTGLKLKGNSAANSLIGGKGSDTLNSGNNNDTLNGGAGNDSLWGGNGADTFIYQIGGGNDTIGDYNFADGDLLTILDKKGKVIPKPIKNGVLNGKDLTLTINGGGKLVLKGVGKSAMLNVNGNNQSF